MKTLRAFAKRASNGKGLSRRLFADDAEQGFAFIDLCRQKFDVVLMNPPFGDASMPSKPYIDETYGDTKGDVYKAFVECFQDRLVPAGFLGIISSRAGFFLSGSSDWRERIVLRLYRPLLLADFGMGVLDAMVETAAYVLRNLTKEEDRELTLELVKDLRQVPTDRNDLFSTKKYEGTRKLKRHQANGELRRLSDAGFVRPVEGHFPRWSPLHGEISKAEVPAKAAFPLLVCLRLLGDDHKGQALDEALHNTLDTRRFVVSPEDFWQIPNTPFSYSVSNRIRRMFVDLRPFGSDGRTVRQGMATADDFRFVRLWWEVLAETVCPASAHPGSRGGPYCVLGEYCWFPFAKGGAYSLYYADISLVVNWAFDGQAIRNFTEPKTGRVLSRPQNTDFYFLPGLTYPLRTSSFSPQVMPAGTTISVRGSGIYGIGLHSYLGLLASKPFDFLIKLLLGRDEHPQFDMGDINLTPIPSVPSTELSLLKEPAIDSFAVKQRVDSTNETSHVFYLPSILQVSGNTLPECVIAWRFRVQELIDKVAAHQSKIDDIAFRLYGFSEADRRSIEGPASGHSLPPSDSEEAEIDEDMETESVSTDRRYLTADLISYAVGCAVGRWDIRFATRGQSHEPELPEAFAALPVCAPGALTSENGLPIIEPLESYPLRVHSDGILVDDPTHGDDPTTRVREVFELIWPKAPEAREREACELLGVKELRDYFRKPAAGGFWWITSGVTARAAARLLFIGCFAPQKVTMPSGSTTTASTKTFSTKLCSTTSSPSSGLKRITCPNFVTSARRLNNRSRGQAT